MNKYLRLICLATCLFAIVSCDKNDHPTPKTDITQTIYEPGKEYTRKFYFGSHAIGGYTPETGVHFIYYFFPECTRLGGGFQLHDYDNGVPTADQINKVIDLNSANKNSTLKYYLVADVKFIYPNTQPLSIGSWRIVIGGFEEYVFDGKIYQQLVIKEQVKE